MTPEQIAALTPLLVALSTLAGVTLPKWFDHRARRAQSEAELARQHAEWDKERRDQREATLRERLDALIGAYYYHMSDDSELAGQTKQCLAELMVEAPPQLQEVLERARHTRPFPLHDVLQAAAKVLGERP